ncbi:hypothetical protein ACDZ29_25570 [Peribacillus sp. RS7]|uniref:hypothetical protein n=1 Tax=Peribacillus sp. RS7 TaxID=3242679 RepID=UPI0035C18E08
MGRNRDIYPEQIIKNIILKCAEDEAIVGEIPYSQVRDFAYKLFYDGKLPKDIFRKKLSDDFWRKKDRQGCQILKEINDARMDSVKEGKELMIVKTEREVNNLFIGQLKDKKRLIQRLKINEYAASKLNEEKKILKNKIKKIEVDMDLLIKEKEKLKVKNQELQLLLFQFMEYSKKKGFPVENIYNTGKTRTEPVSGILRSVFSSNPMLGFEFENYIKDKKESNVIELKAREVKKSSALDEYGEF